MLALPVRSKRASVYLPEAPLIEFQSSEDEASEEPEPRDPEERGDLLSTPAHLQDLPNGHRGSPARSNHPQGDLSGSSKDDPMWKRAQIVAELVDTEKRFVGLISTLDDMFRLALIEKKLLPEEDIVALFSNLPVIRTLQTAFLDQILTLECNAATGEGGDPFGFHGCRTLATLFQQYASHASCFAEYCSSHSAVLSSKRLSSLLHDRPRFADFVEVRTSL